MRLASYCSFPNLFTEEQCNQLIKEGSKDLKIGVVNDNLTPEFNVRKSKVNFLDYDGPVGSLLKRTADVLRSCSIKFFGSYINNFEDIQYAEYKKGDYFKWHQDVSSSKNTHINRDMSASLILSKKSDYKGGSLQFLLPENILNEDNKIKPHDAQNQEQGTLIVFPSLLIHRVTKILSGKRSSLILWSHVNIKKN